MPRSLMPVPTRRKVAPESVTITVRIPATLRKTIEANLTDTHPTVSAVVHAIVAQHFMRPARRKG